MDKDNNVERKDPSSDINGKTVEQLQVTVTHSEDSPNDSNAIIIEPPQATFAHSEDSSNDTNGKIIEKPYATVPHSEDSPNDSNGIIIEEPQATVTHLEDSPNDTNGKIIEQPQATVTYSEDSPNDTNGKIIEQPQATLTHYEDSSNDTNDIIIEQPQTTATYLEDSPNDTSVSTASQSTSQANLTPNKPNMSPMSFKDYLKIHWEGWFNRKRKPGPRKRPTKTQRHKMDALKRQYLESISNKTYQPKDENIPQVAKPTSPENLDKIMTNELPEAKPKSPENLDKIMSTAIVVNPLVNNNTGDTTQNIAKLSRNDNNTNNDPNNLISKQTEKADEVVGSNQGDLSQNFIASMDKDNSVAEKDSSNDCNVKIVEQPQAILTHLEDSPNDTNGVIIEQPQATVTHSEDSPNNTNGSVGTASQSTSQDNLTISKPLLNRVKTRGKRRSRPPSSQRRKRAALKRQNLESISNNTDRPKDENIPQVGKSTSPENVDTIMPNELQEAKPKSPENLHEVMPKADEVVESKQGVHPIESTCANIEVPNQSKAVKDSKGRTKIIYPNKVWVADKSQEPSTSPQSTSTNTVPANEGSQVKPLLSSVPSPSPQISTPSKTLVPANKDPPVKPLLSSMPAPSPLISTPSNTLAPANKGPPLKPLLSSMASPSPQINAPKNSLGPANKGSPVKPLLSSMPSPAPLMSIPINTLAPVSQVSPLKPLLSSMPSPSPSPQINTQLKPLISPIMPPGTLQNFDVICQNTKLETEEKTKRKFEVLIQSSRDKGAIFLEEHEPLKRYIIGEMFKAMVTAGPTGPEFHFTQSTFVEPGWLSIVADDEVSFNWLLNGWPWFTINGATCRPIKALDMSRISFGLATPTLDMQLLFSILLIQNRNLKVNSWIHLSTTGRACDWKFVFYITSEITEHIKAQNWHLFYENDKLVVKLMPLTD